MMRTTCTGNSPSLGKSLLWQPSEHPLSTAPSSPVSTSRYPCWSEMLGSLNAFPVLLKCNTEIQKRGDRGRRGEEGGGGGRRGEEGGGGGRRGEEGGGGGGADGTHMAPQLDQLFLNGVDPHLIFLVQGHRAAVVMAIFDCQLNRLCYTPVLLRKVTMPTADCGVPLPLTWRLPRFLSTAHIYSVLRPLTCTPTPVTASQDQP